VKRRDMKPGTMFVVPWMADSSMPLVWPENEVWVVVDKLTEVGLWSGARAAIGDRAPSWSFEVVS
jgi:hypothetical protein